VVRADSERTTRPPILDPEFSRAIVERLRTPERSAGLLLSVRGRRIGTFAWTRKTWTKPLCPWPRTVGRNRQTGIADASVTGATSRQFLMTKPSRFERPPCRGSRRSGLLRSPRGNCEMAIRVLWGGGTAAESAGRFRGRGPHPCPLGLGLELSLSLFLPFFISGRRRGIAPPRPSLRPARGEAPRKQAGKVRPRRAAAPTGHGLPRRCGGPVGRPGRVIYHDSSDERPLAAARALRNCRSRARRSG
jgi:hypothetical protein